MERSLSHPCFRCVATRRGFLRSASAAALGLMIGPYARLGLAEELEEEIDVQSLRPNPKVSVMAAILRHKPPYWLGWPGTSYNLEGHHKEYTQKLTDACRGLSIDLAMEKDPIENESQVAAFVEKLKDQKPHGVVLILQHIGCWPMAKTVAEAGIPTIVFAPVGTAFTGHVRDFSRQKGVYVVSSLEFPAVEFGLRMIRAKRRFEETRLLWIRQDTRNETVMERLGVKVRRIPRRVFNELFDRMPVTKEVRSVADRMKWHAKKVVEPTKDDLLNASRAFSTAKRLLKDESANALSMDCLGMVGQRLVPTPPCMAWSILQDAGVTAGCEADLFGAVSLMFTSYVFDKPGFINDPVPETAKNLLIAAHCTSGARLNGLDRPPEPYILRTHSESDKGVSMQVLWKVGQPVTLVRFTNPNELILDTGTVVSNVNTPPAGGCRTSFEIKMDDVKDARDVQGFHQVVFYGNHRRDVEAFCQLYDIKVTHSA
ncbi:MAG: hypothetical protein AB1696_19555 [Planctomycetota bacterium]